MNPALENRYYYLDNFEMALQWVNQRYTDLLAGPETDFLTRFPALNRASRALLVRMIMRRGTLFRSSKLRYDEIGDPADAASELVELGWLDDKPLLTLQQLFDISTKAELSQAFGQELPEKNARKAEQFAAIETRFLQARPFNEWRCGTDECVYQLLVMPLSERIRLMFFGNLHQDWSEFVLTDLGLHAYEKVEFSASSRVFQVRSDIDDYLHLHDCRERFRSGVSPEHILPAIPSSRYGNEWLEQRRAKLLFQIARQYEKKADWTRALDVYLQCAHAGSRARAVRMLERTGQFEAALDLAQTASQYPESEAENQQMHRVLPRLLRTLGHAATPRNPIAPIPTLTLALPPSSRTVEELARIHIQSPDSPAYYVENTLINALFGLLCWDAIFAAVPGAFFHPFQRGPADLHSIDFLQRRRERFASCLLQLDSRQYQQTISKNFRIKAGLQSPFVAWEMLNNEILTHALACIPAIHLKKWFKRILLDIRSNRSGFPDLIQFWPRESRYRMIEVKGPGDRLQDNQRRWLDYCAAHDMPVAVCYVQWTQA